MPNNQEFFCNYCKRETIFFQESDLLWYCDECGNVLDSMPFGECDEDELDAERMMENLLRCPTCHNIISISELVMGENCPICFEDLSEEVKLLEYEHSDEDSVIRIIKGE